MKNFKISSLLIAITLFVFTGFNRVNAQTQSNNIPFSVLMWIPCANDGAGELVEGEFEVHVAWHYDKDGNLLRFNANPQCGTAIGLTTGTAFRVVGTTQGLTDINPTTGAFTDTYVNRFRVVGQGGINFIVKQTTHLTINANDEITADVHLSFDDCK